MKHLSGSPALQGFETGEKNRRRKKKLFQREMSKYIFKCLDLTDIKDYIISFKTNQSANR